MIESRIGSLLRSKGVQQPGGITLRSAATMTGISKTTLSNYMQPVDRNRPRPRIRIGNLRKISEGLGIPFEALRRAALADEGHVESVTADDVDSLMLRVAALSPRDRSRMIEEIARLQQHDRADDA